MVHKAENTIYQRHYVSGKESQEFRSSRTLSDNNPTKDLMVHKGSDVSIGTQPEEERMQMQQVMESSE